MAQEIIQESQQTQEIIPKELIEKFSDDEELVRQFLSEGYSLEQLEQSTITHPTRYDPLCTLNNGHVAGMWIERTEMRYQYDERRYRDI